MTVRGNSSMTVVVPSAGMTTVVEDDEIRTRRRLLRFSGVSMACVLLLQRFGLTFGESYVDSVAPIGLCVALYALLTGTLAVSRRSLFLYLIMCASVLMGSCVAMLVSNGYGAVSWTSLIQFVVLCSFATLTFAVPVDERCFFRVVNFWLAFVAVAGLVEFFLQFFGIKVFSFTGLLPDAILVERSWNVVFPIGQTLYDKSNGFFLLEPSLFSQFTGLALIIEILLLRRLPYLFLFGVALITSVSGTGWLMIAGFVTAAVFSLGSLGLLVALATGAVAGIMLAGLAFISPDIYNFLVDRTGEFNSPGSSAFLRFITPWWFASDVLEKWPLTWLFGIGAGLSEHPLHGPVYDYNINSPVKVFVEYGGPALLAFLGLFFTGRRTRVQNALIAPILVWVLSDGGNSETAFVLFPAFLILITARLIPSIR